MGKRDLLPNAIYQRIKQLQTRLKKRAEEEEKRQEMAEKAVTARWEEHQKKMLQFENYLKSLDNNPTENVQRNSTSAPTRIERVAPPNTAEGSPVCKTPGSISLVHIQLIETYLSSSHSQTSNLSRSTTVTPHSSKRLSQATTLSTRSSVRTAKLGESQSTVLSRSGVSPTDSRSDKNSTGKSNLAEALIKLDCASEKNPKEDCSLSPTHSAQSNSNAAFSFSPPPSLPSTPSITETPYQQTPLPLPESPPLSATTSPTPPQVDEINISVTKMITASLETNSTKEVTSQKKVKLKHKKKPPKPPKKKLNRKNEKTSKPSNDLPPIPKETEVLVSNIKSKEDAKKEIKMIFENVNALPDEELTEEAFDVFLDTIKQLSEYVDHEEVDSQTYEVIDEFSSDFSYEAYLRDGSGGILSPDKMFATPSPCISRASSAIVNPKSEKSTHVPKLTRRMTEDKRKERILVVREKQDEIVRYRKVTIAEIRLRRQRALMRVRAKIVENARERDETELQRVRLLEMAHMNERERLERLAQFKREEEERIKEDEERKREQEQRVKEELNQLMDLSKKRLKEEERTAREHRQLEEARLMDADEEVSSTEEESTVSSVELGKGRKPMSWKTAAERIKTRGVFENMIKQNSQNLYKTLIRELIVEKQKSNISDIPGFSYFLLLKYTMDPDDIVDIMLEL